MSVFKTNDLDNYKGTLPAATRTTVRELIRKSGFVTKNLTEERSNGN
jgi:hypothetical protein